MVSVGDYVKVTSYDGPLTDADVVGKIVKVTDHDDKHVVTDHVHSTLQKSNYSDYTWKQKDNVILTHDEYEPVDLDVKDSQGRRIHVGDEIAWAVYEGGLNVGTVTEIVPKQVPTGKWVADENDAFRRCWVAGEPRVEYSLRVEIKGDGYTRNSENKEAGKPERRVESKNTRTYKRRVDKMSRVVLLSPERTSMVSQNPYPYYGGGILPVSKDNRLNVINTNIADSVKNLTQTR